MESGCIGRAAVECGEEKHTNRVTSLTAGSIFLFASQTVLEIEFYNGHAELDIVKLQWMMGVGLTDV